MPTSSDPTDPRELEPWLARLPLAAPRPEFRRELRARFLAAASAPAADLDDARLEEQLRAALAADERPAPSRVAARERFLAAAAPAAPAPVRAQPRSSRRARGPEPTTRRPPLALVGGLAAAAALLVAGLFALRGGAAAEAWSSPDAASAALVAAANAGAELAIAGDEPLDLVPPDARFVLRALPGARFTPPVLEGLAPDAPVRVALAQGELLVRTARGYGGRPIEVVSADASVRVTGTAVSIMTGEMGTCVCVSHGTVRARQLDTGLEEPVGPGETWFSFTRPHPSFGRCYHEAFGHEGGLLGEYEEEHQAPLMELEGEPLFD